MARKTRHGGGREAMSTGPKVTFEFLAKTPNRAATEILVAALDSKNEAMRQHAVGALMERLDPVGHREVFCRLPQLDAACREIIQRRAGRLENVATTSLKEGNLRECQTACHAIVEYHLFDALPGLVSVLLDESSPHRDLASHTILQLAEAFYTRLSEGDEPRSSTKTDLDTLRRRITTSLEEAARKFFKHQHREVVEAFLLVARPQNAALKQLLRNPDDSCHEVVLDLLMTSRRGGVIRLLLGFLDDPQLPHPVIKVLTSRRDKRFIKHLLHRAKADSRWHGCGEVLARFDSIVWARPGDELLSSLDDEGQQDAIHLIAASGMPKEQQRDVIGHLLQEGKPGGRRAAARALAAFKGPEADAMILRALTDEDPEVRAHALRQLRHRGIPNAMLLLIRMVDSPHEVIREALRDAMPEFSFRQFMMTFDSLPEESQLIAGHLVRQIDPEAIPQVAGEMRVISPVRRRRAVQAAAAMGLVQRLESIVADLVSDKDHMVRAAAAMALAESESSHSWEALRDAMCDRSVIVQEAAEQSLARISQVFTQGAKSQTTPPSETGESSLPQKEEVAP